MPSGKPLQLVGRRFGRLLVLFCKGLHPKRRQSMWYCMCDCGKSTVVVGADLNNGHSRSCGCARRDAVVNNTLPKGESVFRSMFTRVRREAKKRGRDFILTQEEYRNFTKQPCAYCGSPPTYQYGTSRVNGGSNGCYIGNGVDRIDSSRGYTLSNCAPCCNVCNTMKRHYSVEEFLIRIEQIHNYQRRPK